LFKNKNFIKKAAENLMKNQKFLNKNERKQQQQNSYPAKLD